MAPALSFSTPGFWELMTLAVLALLVFGPDKLPGMARRAGRTLARVKTEAASTLDELKRSADLDELRDIADDLRSTGSELERTAASANPVASTKRPAGSRERTRQADTPPPFDPDAT